MSEEEIKDAPETEKAPQDEDVVELEAAEAEADASAAEDKADAKPTGKKKKRWPVVVGVIVVVLIVAVVGGLKWHESPSFCNAICHTPMDGYLETYNAEPGEAATDKWGDEVANASSMLAAVHREESDGDITCLSCHEPTMSEQLAEGSHWLTGSYEVWQTADQKFVPSERNFTELTAARGATAKEMCLNENCHLNDDGTTMTIKDLAKLTTGGDFSARNPHSHWKHAGNISCGDCHKAHRASTVYCTKCHEDTYVPEGWVSYSEAESVVPVSLKGDDEE